jgi:serine/threonine protein kinase
MQTESEDQARLRFSHNAPLPRWAHALAAAGKQTEAVIYRYFSERGSYQNAFQRYSEIDLLHFAEVAAKWTDTEAATLVGDLINLVQSGHCPDMAALAKWASLHVNQPREVYECMTTEPPDQVEIIKVLSRAGSQKVVFEAKWGLTQRKIVLKKLAGASTKNVLAHEASSNPLSISAPTIIQTVSLDNSRGETFLLERRLPEVLSDSWTCGGIQQAANLLYCLADAITVVHSLGRVHGDIKPDNIGREDDLFILLDFGICRRTSEFTKDTTATGSLRTRAPELLLTGAYTSDPQKVDIWAIGATLFNFLVGRYPLIDREEKIPRLSKPEERKVFEAELERRVAEEWSRRVVFDKVHELMKPVLQPCLERDPDKRPTAMELKESVHTHLSVFLRTDLGSGGFAPIDELKQLSTYLPTGRALALMPAGEKTKLRKTLERLRATQGFNQEQLKVIATIENRLNA